MPKRKSGVDPRQLFAAADRLGETVVDPTAWPAIMDHLCRASGSTGAILLRSDGRDSSVPFTASLERLSEVYFRDHWHTRDLRGDRGIPLLLAGAKVITDEDVVSPDEMRKAPYYNECFIPEGFQWFAGIGFHAGNAHWALSVQRTIGEGAFDKSERHILASLADRLSEAATLSSAIGYVALTSAINALDAVPQPAIAIDRVGFVLQTNSGAEALFGTEMFVRNKRLLIVDRDANAALELLVARLRVTPDTSPIADEPIVVRRRSKPPIVIRVLTVPCAARGPFVKARALLTFTTADNRPVVTAAVLAKAFGLTPAEAKLAHLLAKARSPEEAAGELGIARVTARNQLRAVFAKTGTHRQAELVALLAKM